MKRKLPPTNLVQKTRLFFGFSQQHFADYLGTSRSTLAMAELDQRELNGAPYLKYLGLLVLVEGKNGMAQQAPAPLPPPDEKHRQELLFIARQQAHEAEKYRMELEAMQQRYLQASRMLAFCAQKLPTLTGDAAESDRLLLQLEQLEANQTLSRNGAGPQALLQWKLDGYLSGAERAKELAGE